MQPRWIFQETANDAVRALAREFRLPPCLAGVLVRNGLASSDNLTGFLQPRLRNLSDPNLLPELPAAVERIDLALRRKERIVLYGDYDVDGVASLALLYRLLIAYGGCVECFLPHRVEEGYGLSEAGIDRCFELYDPQLLIAVDCGTNAIREIAAVRHRGADVIVLDHHEPRPARPDCTALVNPKRGDGAFSFLCSAGIAFKTAHALLKRSPLPSFDLKTTLDIVALATLCDLVPLTGENRTLVRAGLDQMASTRWPGLAALMRVAAVSPPVSSGDVGFRLGPRINASGRLGTAQESLRLLLTNDPHEAARIAASLERQNRERQLVERSVTREVEAWVDAHFDPSRHASIVAGRRDWHTGVLGIVASRITRRHHRPALVVGFDEDGHGKGSGRSIEGLSLVDVLSQCSGLLGKFGGHEMAAGLNVSEHDFEAFRAAFETAARAMLDDEMLVPRLHLDGEIDLVEISESLLDAQELLEPFGMANRQPVLWSRAIVPVAAPRVLKEKHLQFQFPAGRRSLYAIFFNGAEHDLPRPPWDVAFHIERNEFNGRIYPQMQIVDIRAAA
jgi:single-stranded-DNA-specific exonuclease